MKKINWSHVFGLFWGFIWLGVFPVLTGILASKTPPIEEELWKNIFLSALFAGAGIIYFLVFATVAAGIMYVTGTTLYEIFQEDVIPYCKQQWQMYCRWPKFYFAIFGITVLPISYALFFHDISLMPSALVFLFFGMFVLLRQPNDDDETVPQGPPTIQFTVRIWKVW